MSTAPQAKFPPKKLPPGQHPYKMMKSFLTLAIVLTLASNALVETWRVHYSIRGSGRDITVQAESSAEARRIVMEMFPGCVVTGVNRIKK
jgi:hypothetical protein